jgi:hypothetical protein
MARSIADHAAHVYHSARSWPGNGRPVGPAAPGSGGAPAPPAEPRPNVTRVTLLVELREGGGAVLEDGSELQGIDSIVYCTGYRWGGRATGCMWGLPSPQGGPWARRPGFGPRPSCTRVPVCC